MAVAATLRLIDALDAAARSLAASLDADACAISRVLGDVLVLVTEHAPPGRTLQLGTGYLVSEYPETRRVLEGRRPRSICVGQAGVDEAEELLLRRLGYGSLLMLPLELAGAAWGLVEVYRVERRPFGGVEVRAAASVLAELSR